MYIFNHIPKTAGTSLIAIMQDVFGKDRVSTHIDITEDRDYEIDPEQFTPFVVVAGHFGVKWHARMGDRRWLTVLREPVDRVLSTYYFWRNVARPRPNAPYLDLAKTLFLNEFVSCGNRLVLQGISNGQTWQLADDLREKYRSVPESDALAIAKENLTRRFDFVGLSEHFDESAARLRRYLGVPEKARCEVPRLNLTPDRRHASELRPSVIDNILELNRMDIELYRFAQELWSQPDPGKSNGRPL